MALECHGRRSNPSHTTTPQLGNPEFSKNRHGSSWSFFLLHAGVELHITSVPVGIRRGLMGPMSK